MRKIVTVAGYGTCTIVFDSPWAKALGAIACVLFKDRIDVASNQGLSARAFAHEWRHVVQRRKRGILYGPWAIYAFLKDKYAGSKAEEEANQYEEEHWQNFPNVSAI
jgi:hypothetical protein